MFRLHKNLKVPVIVTQINKNQVNALIPDFNVTVHSHDFVSVISDATMVASSMYYFYIERNIQFELNCTLAKAEKMAMKKKNSFATLVGIVI